MKKESKLNEEQQELLNRFCDHLAHVWEAYHVVNDIHTIAEPANDKQQIHLEWFARIFLRYLVVTVLHFFDNPGSDPDKQNLSIRFLKKNLKSCIFGAVAKDAFVQQPVIIDEAESEEIWNILKKNDVLSEDGKINNKLTINQDNISTWLGGKSKAVKDHVLSILNDEKTVNASLKILKELRDKYLAHNSVNRHDQKITDNEAKEHIKLLLDYCNKFYETIDPTMGSLETAAGLHCYVQQLLTIGVQLSKYPKLYLAIKYPDENELLLKKLNSVAENWPNN